MAIEPLHIYRGVNIDGRIENTDFFPLTPRVTGTTQPIVAGAGIRTVGNPHRFFINVSQLTIDVTDSTVFTDRTMWREWFSGGPANASSLTVVNFLATDWVDDAGDLKVTLSHNLDTQNINVTFYESGMDSAVYVPWEYNPAPGEAGDSIVACIPPGAAFTGFIRITSDIATATPERYDEYEFDGSTAFWNPDGTDKSFLRFTYDFSSARPQTEIYDSTHNEVLACISLDPNLTNTIRITVYRGDEFSGYLTVRG